MIINITINGTGSPFTILYGSSVSTNLTTDTSASQFQSAITAIIDGAVEDDIMVVKHSIDNQTIFQVITFEGLLNNSLEVGEHNSLSLSIDIVIVQMGRYPANLVLSFPTRNSSTISLPSNSSVIKQELYKMISVSCNKTSTAAESDAVYWEHTYDNSPGRVWGILDNSIDPMCGRYSLKNPTTIFRALASQDELTQMIKDEIAWETFNWVNITIICMH